MLFNVLRTEKLSVGTGAAADSTYTNANRPIVLAVSSTAGFHATVTTAGAATTNAMYYPGETIHFFELPAGKTFSVRGTSTTSLWVSEVAISG